MGRLPAWGVCGASAGPFIWVRPRRWSGGPHCKSQVQLKVILIHAAPEFAYPTQEFWDTHSAVKSSQVTRAIKKTISGEFGNFR